MTAQIIVLSKYRKAKEPKDLGYAEWLRFCMDPFGFLGPKTEKPKPTNGGRPTDAGNVS